MKAVERRTWSGTAVLAWGFSSFAFLSVLVGLLLLLRDSWPVWQAEGLGFVTGERWFFRQEEFGAAAMIYGSFVVTVIAVLLAAPVGFLAALFGTEFLPRKFRLPIKLTTELLAGIPSVVYGLLGVLLLRDWIYELLEDFDPLSGDTLLTAAVLLAVMILPTLMSLADEAFAGISGAQRMAARGLGLGRAQTALAVTLPQALPGLIAAVLLGFGRALGETIAVFLVVGRQDNQWPEQLLSPEPIISAGQTLTSKLGGSETNIAYGDSLHWGAVTGLGLILLIIICGVTFAGLALQNYTGRGNV